MKFRVRPTRLRTIGISYELRFRTHLSLAQRRFRYVKLYIFYDMLGDDSTSQHDIAMALSMTSRISVGIVVGTV